MKNIKYYYYSLLSRLASPDQRYHYQEKSRYYKYSTREQTLMLLKNIENHIAFEKFYTYFKKTYNVEIPLEADGGGNHYEYVKVKLKDLKGYCPGSKPKFKPLNETFQYRFLLSRDSACYETYLTKSRRSDTLHFSPQKFLDLEKQLQKDGYNPQQSIIVINGDNCIRDGLHRTTILIYQKGPETEIPVVRITTR